jgi:hypothetical protein
MNLKKLFYFWQKVGKIVEKQRFYLMYAKRSQIGAKDGNKNRTNWHYS